MKTAGVYGSARAAFIVATVLALCLVPMKPAHAAISCSLGAGTLTVTAWAGTTLTIKRSGSSFSFVSSGGDSSTCGGTMTNVNTVNIARGNNVAFEHVIIDLSGGQFEPGLTAEGSGTSEIEFQVDLGGCLCIPSEDQLEFRGSSGADTIRLAGGLILFPEGTPGAFLNTDNDLDVTIHNDLGILTTIVNGLAGNDTLKGGALGRIPYPWRMKVDGGDGSDDISGGSGNDVLKESTGSDQLNGGAGNDTLQEAAGITAPTSYLGGSGQDTVEAYLFLADPISMTIDGVANDMVPGEGDNIGLDVENLEAGQGNDVLVGSAADNRLFGGLGNDRLRGGAGNDELDGWSGDDLLFQGAAPDGADTLIGSVGTDTISYGARTEGVTITVDGLANDGAAGEGDDIQDGEILIGGKANDTLSAGPGAQTLNGGLGRDTIDYSDRTDPVSVSFDGVDNDGVAAENDYLTNIEDARGGSAADDLSGSDGDNALFGMGGNDQLSGGGGNDDLTGGAGDDEEFGNPGNDTFHQDSADDGSEDLFGGLGRDTVDYGLRSASVSVSLNGLPDDGGSVENDNVAIDVENAIGGSANDLLKGIGSPNILSGRGGKDTMTGAGGSDQLSGGPGPDLLKGEDGNDKLLGGGGDDSLNGGAGTDSCDGGPGADTITACE
jgi:Ca2+-binding RTX toxin-like protein